MQLKKIIEGIEELIPMYGAEDFDNVGLLCGDPEREITGILVCHDALLEVIDEAVSLGKNLIVSFHPIIFSGLKSITGKNYVEKAVLKAMESGIAIYAAHTAFDNYFFGVNFGICEALGLKNSKILMPKSGMLRQLSVYCPPDFSEKVRAALFSAGAGKLGFYEQCSWTAAGSGTFLPVEGANPFIGESGRREELREEMVSVIFEAENFHKIVSAVKAAHPYEVVAYQVYHLENSNEYSGLGRFGELPEPMETDDFLEFVKEKFNLKIIRHNNFKANKIQRVAVLGGSGAIGIRAAVSAGCDAYLCGDLKYHDFFSADGRLLLCDIGHYESEQFVVPQLFGLLSGKFPKFAIRESTVKTNPVNYFF